MVVVVVGRLLRLLVGGDNLERRLRRSLRVLLVMFSFGLN